MPHVQLRYPACLTLEQAKQAWTPGQTRFWVAELDGKGSDIFKRFVDIGLHGARYPIAANVDLPYGWYLLGCGFGHNKLRKRFSVDLMGVHWL